MSKQTSQESSPIVRRSTTCYNGGMVASVEVISKRPAIHGDQNHTQEFRVKYYLYEDAERYDTLEDALVKACDFDDSEWHPIWASKGRDDYRNDEVVVSFVVEGEYEAIGSDHNKWMAKA